MEDYRVQLDSYSGPMDLLLYLIRRDEVDIYDIPISGILEQYLGYVKLLQAVDPEVVGEFLVLAATLMEIKSRMLLPKPPPEATGDDMLDPRSDLVRQLLAYRTFREAALRLADKAELHSQRYARPGQDVPGDDSFDLEDVQIWDLLTAFNKLLAAVGRNKATHDVRYDDTPITLHAADVLDRLEREGPTMPFERIFEGRNRGEMVGLFLALLELIRQHRVRIQQERAFGTIVVTLVDSTPITTVLDATPDAEAGAEGAVAAEFELEAEVESEVEVAVEDAPFEEVGPAPVHEALFEEEEEDDDDFSRRIKAVEIADVDLGRVPRDDKRGRKEPDASSDGSSGEPPPDSPDEARSSDE
jgi:segregation and condensation protein A